MKLKLLSLSALFACSTTYGMGWDPKRDASPDLSRRQSLIPLQGLQPREAKTAASTSSTSSSSSSTTHQDRPYRPSFRWDHLGTTYFIYIDDINETNLSSFAEYLEKQAKNKSEQIGIQITRRCPQRGSSQSLITVEGLKLIARYFPALRGLDLTNTGLSLEEVRFLTQSEIFPMLEWLNISENFTYGVKSDIESNSDEETTSTDSEEKEKKETDAELALKLIFSPKFAPFLKRLEIRGLNTSEYRVRKLINKADLAKIKANTKLYRRAIEALDLAVALDEEEIVGYEDTVIIGSEFELIPGVELLGQRLIVILSEGYIEPYQVTRKREIHEQWLQRTLKRHKTLQQEDSESDKGKEEAQDEDSEGTDNSDEL